MHHRYLHLHLACNVLERPEGMLYGFLLRDQFFLILLKQIGHKTKLYYDKYKLIIKLIT
jgi:hypothetical protein